MRNLMLIVNPYSGRRLSKAALGTVVSQLSSSGWVVTVYFSGQYSIQELAQKFAKHYEICVCAGGDGTLSGVISGLLRAGYSIPVGYIPAGTANDIATTLALSKDPAVAAQTIMEGRPIPIDIGSFVGTGTDGSRTFVYIAAFGAFTEVSYSTPHSTKRALGHFAYILGGIADMTSITARRAVVEFDNGVIEGDFIFGGVMNSTSVAGLVRLDPDYVDLADGLFEVILVKQPLSLADFLDIMTSIANRSYKGDKVQMIQSKSVKFTFDDGVAWTIDGEDGGAHRQVEISNLHAAIEIIV